MGLAYLLARASDTIADSAGASPEARIRALRLFGEALRSDVASPSDPALLLAELSSLEAGVPDASERALLARTGTLLELFRSTEAEDRADILFALEEILRGQTLDVQRFGSSGPVRALANACELNDYTYSVAGCVGEFWTRICQRHLARYSRLGAKETVRLGIAFGKGLQLVNILRDMPADLANGRCYLPQNEIGCDPETLRTDPQQAREAFRRWISVARERLQCGYEYIEAVRPWRLRFACFLPWALGMQTLALVERTLPLENAARVKVSRKEVRRLFVWGVLVAANNAALRLYAKRFAQSGD